MRNSTDIHALAGAYALDALTEIERAAFARHLAACPSCAVEAAELTETASRLGSAALQPAPARLRASVLAEVARTRQVSSGMPGRRRYGDMARRWAAASVAAIVGVVGIATAWVVQQARIDDVRHEAQSEQARLAGVLAAGDARVMTTALTGGGRLVVAVSRRLDTGVVLISDLPRAPEGKTYQIWLLSEASTASLAVMSPDARAGATDVAGVAGVDRVAVTIEPVGGSLGPTSEPIGSVALA
jgi:anti-sigma factor RsiW